MLEWLSPDVDWTASEGRRVVQLLERAYPDQAAIRRIAIEIGLDLGPVALRGPIDEDWRTVLFEASRHGLAVDVAAYVLHRGGRDWAKRMEILLGDVLVEAKVRWRLRTGVRGTSEDSQGDWSTDYAALEAYDPAANPILSVEEAADVPVRAMRRLAQIEIAGRLVGTGFLVGPDLLLTSHHVVESPPLDDAVAIFDHGGGRGVPFDALLRRPIVGIEVSSPPAQSELDRQFDAWQGVSSDRLDFALLRLAGPVADLAHPDDDGKPRGFFGLFRQRYRVDGEPLLTLVHHPAAMSAKQSTTKGVVELNEHGSRIRYRASTLPGSSGCPVFDQRGRLVGLHQAGTGKVSHLLRGQAIPAWLIARHIAETDEQLLVSPETVIAAPRAAIDPFSAFTVGAEPFVNRTDFRDLLRETSTGDVRRRLFIAGTGMTGISTSYRLIAHAAAVDDSRRALIVDLRDYLGKTTEERFHAVMESVVGDLLNAAPLQDGSPRLVPPAPDEVRQWAREGKVFLMFSRRAVAASGKQWWFFIDSIDDVDELTDELEQLILGLIKLSRDPGLDFRVVLAGKATVGLPPSYGTTGTPDDTSHRLTREDSRNWVTRRAEAENRNVDEHLLETELDALFNRPSGPPLPDIVALTLPSVWDKVAT